VNVPQELQELWDYEKAHPDNRLQLLKSAENSLRKAHSELVETIQGAKSVEECMEEYLWWVACKARLVAASKLEDQ